jgi:enoyl-CoA hydratase
MSSPETVRVTRDGPVTVITIDRPDVRNAVDRETAETLCSMFQWFDSQENQRVAVLTGAGDTFCAGADLKAMADGRGNQVRPEGDGPMGPTRLLLSKPVIAAVEGHAVAGGLELAIWCDLRVVARDATFGVFCRRWGGTIRLPRLVGHGNALDMILTGRAVGAHEAAAMGLANRLVEPGTALEAAVALAHELAELPQVCLRSDRLSSYEQWDLPLQDALAHETIRGLDVIASAETQEGARRFAEGAGRHGAPT